MQNTSSATSQHNQEKLPTLLVIDDEPAVTDGVSRLLHGDVNVMCANSGRDALAVFTNDISVDYILMDVTMPDYDAVELMEDLSAFPNVPPIVLFSGWRRDVLDTTAKFAKYLGLRVIGTFEKPVSKADIVRTLGRLATASTNS